MAPLHSETAPLLHEVLKGYSLPARGDHGVIHWARVLENGLRLAEMTGANARIVTLFSLFHDARRINEFDDEGHGLRGAELSRLLRGRFFKVSDDEFALLYQACRLHTDGHTTGDVTMQSCWDADRLDLGRVGITPLPHKLCSNAARSMISWAHQRAVTGFEPDVLKTWRI